jgi:hypothetical protein
VLPHGQRAVIVLRYGSQLSEAERPARSISPRGDPAVETRDFTHHHY